jgi:RNA polymerase sigma-70 factor (ECF subfamily)
MQAAGDDETLMLRYRDGDATAFEALFARHRGTLYRFLRRQCGSAPLAEELYQEAWIRVIDARTRYEPRARFTTWLYSIAHNLLADHYRRTSRRPQEATLDDEDSPLADLSADVQREPPAILDRKRLAQRLVAAIDALPAMQREAFLLQQEGGLSVEEIAAATGVGFETAKSRLRYALTRLRQSLADLQLTDSQ